MPLDPRLGVALAIALFLAGVRARTPVVTLLGLALLAMAGAVSLANRSSIVHLVENIDVPVLQHPVRAGEVITKDAVRSRNVALSSVPAETITAAADLIGRMAVSNIGANTILTKAQAIEFVEIPVATRPIARGQSVTPRDFIMQRVPLNAVSSETVVVIPGTDGSSLEAAGTIVPHQPLVRSMLRPRAGSDRQAVGLVLSARGALGGALHAGNAVDVYEIQKGQPARRRCDATVLSAAPQADKYLVVLAVHPADSAALLAPAADTDLFLVGTPATRTQ